MPIITRIVKVIIVFVILASFLQSFGYNVNSVIAGFGITGLAVGFAAKEAIGNVFGSIGLLADRVYKVGDYISFDSYECTVTEINFRSTTITTLEGFEVNIPNNLLANNEITNVTKASERRIDLSVDIEYGTSNEKIDKALEILAEIATANPDIKDGYDKQTAQNVIKQSVKTYINSIAPGDSLYVGDINRIGLNVEGVEYFNVVQLFNNDEELADFELLQTIQAKFMLEDIVWWEVEN
jgi:small-conductance mechanosensitive channel